MKADSLDHCYKRLGFSKPPFRLTPDTSFFYPGGSHVAALDHLRFGLMSGGFAMLTGEVGLGKTLLCRYLLQTPVAGVRFAYIFNPQQSYTDLIMSIGYDLTGRYLRGNSVGQLHEQMYQHLVRLAKGGERAVVLVDEAHRLNPALLEGLRLLSNLETEQTKLISFLLIGQPELEQTLALPHMRPLAQRISVHYRLAPFDYRETVNYIRHRLHVANTGDAVSFNIPSLYFVHKYSGGVPRRINQICDRALLAAYADGKTRVNARQVWRAMHEVAA